MKKFLIAITATAALCGAASAQQGSSLNVNPNVNAAPYTQASGNQVSPATLNGAAIGSGNLNGNSLQTANGNSALNGNSVGNGALNGTHAGNGLNSAALNGTRLPISGNQLPILNGTRVSGGRR